MFQHISSEPLREGLSINDMTIFVCKPTLMQGMFMTRAIENSLWIIAHTLKLISLHGSP